MGIILKKCEHGGDPSLLEKLYGPPSDGWLDLSTGINPKPYKSKTIMTANWNSLPNTKDLKKLQQIAASNYGVKDPNFVTVAPGTQAIIQWLPRMRGKSRVLIASPTYNEHAYCWKMAGHIVEEIDNFEKSQKKADVIIIVNPNNPDGRQITPNYLKKLAQKQAKHDGWLIVDEAFCDVAPSISLASEAGIAGLIILRSFGKFYGLAGLRLGFALSNYKTTEQLSKLMGPWAVSSPALEIGKEALNDKNWTLSTLNELKISSERLDKVLISNGLNIIGGTSLFRLASSDHTDLMFDFLAKQGIMTRRFHYQSKWLRFGLPGLSKDWDRLELALKRFNSQ